MTVVVSSHLLSEIDQMARLRWASSGRGSWCFRTRLEALHARSRHNLALRTADNQAARAAAAQNHVAWRSGRRRNILRSHCWRMRTLPSSSGTCCGQRQIGRAPRLEERQKSLEDIFLELTGGKAASL